MPCRMLRKYDNEHDPAFGKTDADGKFRDVEEDAFQKKVAARLGAKEVDPNDKSMRAYITRFRYVCVKLYVVLYSNLSFIMPCPVCCSRLCSGCGKSC